jgi:hypothetical protein
MLVTSSRNEEAGEIPARSRHCIRPTFVTVESQTLFVIDIALTGRA